MTFLRPLLPLSALLIQAAAAGDLIIADFEGPDFGTWKTTGTAFGNGPSTGSLDGQMKVDGFEGKGFANSYHGGDDATGTLTSPEFTLEKPYLNFLIGGGGFADETSIQLLIDGKVVQSATGPNVSPGGSERLRWETWDIASLKGRKATLQIIDQRKGTWGHITIDQIEQSDEPKIAHVTKTLRIDRRYLLWPVAARDSRGGARVFFEIDGKPFTFSDIDLSAAPDFWTFTDLADFQGKTLTLRTTLPASSLKAWDEVKLSDSFPGEDSLYQEPLRPQFHFSSRRGWINDPNGLIYIDGVWHLFYQHNPYNHGWDNMHWGHATSTDLLHWKEMPNALYPGPEGTMFSGSAFLVPKGRSILPVEGNEAIALAYTAEGSLSYLPDQPSLQSAAISNDGGKTFTKFAQNPLLGQYAPGNRDPKVFYYAPTESWVMPIYLQGHQYGLFTSPDLKTWTSSSQYEIPGEAECPDLFEISLDGDARVKRWIAWGATGRYMVGGFNGKEFRSAGGGVRRHYFGNAYAGQTYSNAPDGRRVHIGWMRDGADTFAGQPFNLQMTLPMEFTLRATLRDVRLWIEPAPETESLRIAGATQEWKNVEAGTDPLASFKGELFEVDATLDVRDLKGPAGFRIFDKEELVWNPADQTFSGAEGQQEPVDNRVRIHTFVDRTSVETFVNGTYVGHYLRQNPGKQPVKLITAPGSQIESLKITPLESVWK